MPSGARSFNWFVLEICCLGPGRDGFSQADQDLSKLMERECKKDVLKQGQVRIEDFQIIVDSSMAAATEIYSGLIWWIWSDNDSKPGAIWFVSACRLARLGSSQCAPCEGHGWGSWVGYGMIWMEMGQQTHWAALGIKGQPMTTLRNLLLAICFFRHFDSWTFQHLCVFFWDDKKAIDLSTCPQRGHEWSQKGQRSPEDRSGVVAVGAVKIEMNSPIPNSCFEQFYKLA